MKKMSNISEGAIGGIIRRATSKEIRIEDKPTSLDTVIGVVTMNNGTTCIGVPCVNKDGSIDVVYPLETGDNIESALLACGTKIKFTITPATKEQIKAWRNASGVGRSVRKSANTVEKVKNIDYVQWQLERDSEIITNY